MLAMFLSLAIIFKGCFSKEVIIWGEKQRFTSNKSRNYLSVHLEKNKFRIMNYLCSRNEVVIEKLLPVALWQKEKGSQMVRGKRKRRKRIHFDNPSHCTHGLGWPTPCATSRKNPPDSCLGEPVTCSGKEHCGPLARPSFPSASRETIFSIEKTASVVKLTTKILLIFSPLLEAFPLFSYHICAKRIEIFIIV